MAYRYFLSYASVIRTHPLQLYVSALIFSPARNKVRSLFQKEENKLGWIRAKPVTEDNWSSRLQTLERHGDQVNSVAWSPDDTQIESGSHEDYVTVNGTAKIWAAGTGQCIKTFNGDIDSSWFVAWSPNGIRLASWLRFEGPTINWDAETGQCVKC